MKPAEHTSFYIRRVAAHGNAAKTPRFAVRINLTAQSKRMNTARVTKKVSFSPSLLGLSKADINIPTPLGTIRCRLKKDKLPQITVPEGITLEIS